MKQRYKQVYGTTETKPMALVDTVAGRILSIIAYTDAPYHDVTHTLSVITVGQQILEGQQRLEGQVTPRDWVNITTALMFHDAGYIKGACREDRVEAHRYATGIDEMLVFLDPQTTDASLAPYHINRGQRIAKEMLQDYGDIDLEVVQAAIEFTRFPVPPHPVYQDNIGYFGLVRAADLIGQLADPAYLERLPDLFEELAETGIAAALGYHHPADLRAAYPQFFREVVYPYIQPALLYLNVTPQGRQTVERLYTNLARSEYPEPSGVGISDFCQIFIDDCGQML